MNARTPHLSQSAAPQVLQAIVDWLLYDLDRVKAFATLTKVFHASRTRQGTWLTTVSVLLSTADSRTALLVISAYAD